MGVFGFGFENGIHCGEPKYYVGCYCLILHSTVPVEGLIMEKKYMSGLCLSHVTRKLNKKIVLPKMKN